MTIRTIPDCNGVDIRVGDTLQCLACRTDGLNVLFELKIGAQICAHWGDGAGGAKFEVLARPTDPNSLKSARSAKGITIDIGFTMGPVVAGGEFLESVPGPRDTVLARVLESAEREMNGGLVVGVLPVLKPGEVRTISSEAEYRELYGTPSGGVFDRAAAPLRTCKENSTTLSTKKFTKPISPRTRR